MHFHRIGMVKVHDILHRNSLTKISFKAIHAHIQQRLQFSLIPGYRIRIGKVYKCHARLPQVRLPYTSVFLLHQISIFFSFFKQAGFLADVWVDPYTDVESAVVVAFQHAFWIREGRRIPFKVTPLIGIHPVAVKMEDMQRYLSVCHSLNKAGSGRLIVIGGKGSCQPQAKRPRRRQSRFSGQVRVFFYGSHRRFSTDHIVIQTFPLYGKLDPFYLLTGDLIRHIALVVHQDTVAFVCHIERDIFISNLTGRSAILVPHLHHLSVFYERRETLPESVDIFIHIEKHLLQHIVFSGFCVLHIGKIPETRLCEESISLIKCHLISIRCFIDHRFQRARLIDQLLLILLDPHMRIAGINLCKRSVIYGSVMMHRRHFDHTVHRTGQCHRQKRDIQTASPIHDMGTRQIHRQFLPVYPVTSVLYCIGSFHLITKQPVTIGKFHNFLSPLHYVCNPQKSSHFFKRFFFYYRNFPHETQDSHSLFFDFSDTL